MVIVRASLSSPFLVPRLSHCSSCVWRDPVYHQVIFAGLMFTNAFRTWYLLSNKEFTSRLPEQIRKPISHIFLLGAGTFAFGFFVWNLDNIFCSNITRWKQMLGWPAAFVLEGKLVPVRDH